MQRMREEEFMSREDLALAQRLSAIELARLSGTKDISLEEFRHNMLEAIDLGVKQKK